MTRDARDPSSPSAWLLPLTILALGGLAWACQDAGGGNAVDGGTDGDGDGDGDDVEDGPVTRRDVLQSIASQVIAPGTVEFSEVATALQSAVAAHASDPTDADLLVAAQDAWHAAHVTWQRLEIMQVGPAASSLSAPAGEDIRDSIYSWPTADTCAVDRALVDQDYAADDFFVTELVWAHGMDALEYLLFSHEPTHTCPSQVQLDPEWNALGTAQVDERRAAYAHVVAGGIENQATMLATRWGADDFGAMLANPGQGDSPYDSDIQALDDVFRAMFYIDKQTKDGKLGIPMGLVDGCPAVPCLSMMEAGHSGAAASSIVSNLEALRLVLLGGPDPATADGFDDLLDGLGQGEIAEALLTDIDMAIAVAQSFDTPLQDVVAAEPDDLLPLHAAIKKVSDTLKGPFVMALMLTIPAEGAGDND